MTTTYNLHEELYEYSEDGKAYILDMSKIDGSDVFFYSCRLDNGKVVQGKTRGYKIPMEIFVKQCNYYKNSTDGEL